MELRTGFIGIGLATAVLLGVGVPAQAGWVQTDRDGARTLIAGGKVKEMPEEPGEGWFVMDYRNQQVLLSNPGQHTCSVASFEEYCQTVQGFVAAMNKSMAAFAGEEEGKRTPAVEVKKLGPGGQIAGFETLRYQVYADGQLYEELWLTTDKALMDDIGDPSSFQGLEQCLGGLESDVEGNPSYVKVITSGWPLKSISHEYGEGEVDTEVVSLEKKDIPSSEFALPSGCRRVPLQESLSGM